MISTNNQLSHSKKSQELLKKIAEMIDKGANSLQAKPIKLSKLSLKQTYLYLVFGVANSYSEAIIKLCKDFRGRPAIVLLRPILECWINIIYFLSHNSDNRLRVLIMYDSFSTLGMLEEMRVFSKKYPWITEKTILSESNLKKARSRVEEDLNDLRKNGLNLKSKKKLTALPYFEESLLERAKKVDNRLRGSNSKKPLHSFEYQYQVVYRYFSDHVHVNLPGANNFLVKTESGFNFFTSQSDDEVEVVLETLYVFYLSFLNKLKQYKIVSVPNLSKFNKYFNEEINTSKPH